MVDLSKSDAVKGANALLSCCMKAAINKAISKAKAANKSAASINSDTGGVVVKISAADMEQFVDDSTTALAASLLTACDGMPEGTAEAALRMVGGCVKSARYLLTFHGEDYPNLHKLREKLDR